MLYLLIIRLIPILWCRIFTAPAVQKKKGIFTAPTMGLDETVAELGNGDRTHQARAICLHAYYDLSRVSPVVFLYLLKECYAYGKISPHPSGHKRDLYSRMLFL